MHPGWLSNAYLLGDEPGGTAVFVDSGAPLEPLHRVRRARAADSDPSARDARSRRSRRGQRRARRAVRARRDVGPIETGGLRIDVAGDAGPLGRRRRPSSSATCASRATRLFRDAVGGGPADEVRRSVMDVLMALPHETRVFPGHTDETTIGREWDAQSVRPLLAWLGRRGRSFVQRRR